MTPAHVFNEQQRTRWNGIDGEFWTREQDRLEAMLAPSYRTSARIRRASRRN